MEEYAVKITPQAQKQLEEITHYIAFTLQAPEAALDLLEKLEHEIASLSNSPAALHGRRKSPGTA